MMSVQEAVSLPLPTSGKSWAEIRAEMQRARSNDAKWHEGRTFGMVYPASDEISRVAQEAHALFFIENGFHSKAFPSLIRFESEVVGMTANLLHGVEAVGNITSGGTESIFLAVKAARDQARKERGITSPRIVVPRSAYPVFNKIALYLGMEIVRIPIDADFKADLAALRAAITGNTVLVAGSAPEFSYGVVDPIAEMAAIAAERGINFHVDASVGGFQLPFVCMLGHPIPDFDFSVPGVTSIHADLHKFGYSAVGTSVVLYRNAALHQHQMFDFDDWPLGPWHSPGMLGTRPGAAIAASWAIMQYLGQSGYLRLTESLWNTTQRMIHGINTIPGLQVWGRPAMSVFAYGSATLDIYVVADLMDAKGWWIRRQIDPPSIHVVLTPPHERIVESYLADLREAVEQVQHGKNQSAKR